MKQWAKTLKSKDYFPVVKLMLSLNCTDGEIFAALQYHENISVRPCRQSYGPTRRRR